jgi:hypothetical protein
MASSLPVAFCGASERSFRPRGRPLKMRWPATRTPNSELCVAANGVERVCRVWIWLDSQPMFRIRHPRLKLGSRQIRCATYRRMDVRQRNAKNQRHCTHALYRPGTPDPAPSPRRACAAESGRPVPPSPVHAMFTLTYPNCLLTTVPERVVSVGRKPRERCRVPKVQAALCPATMPYRRLIDDARRP